MKQLFKRFFTDEHILRGAQLVLMAAAVLITFAVTGDPVAAGMGGVLGAIVTVKAGAITNADATPVVLNRANIARGRMLHLAGVAAFANGDSATSTYRMFRVKSNDRMTSLVLDTDAQGGSAAADIGLYRTAADGGAVVDADLFTSAISTVSALRGTDVLRESAVITVANMEKMLWELAGLTADPQVDYDVTVTLTVATGAAGSMALSGTVVGQS
jgi:hypothetical protein